MPNSKSLYVSDTDDYSCLPIRLALKQYYGDSYETVEEHLCKNINSLSSDFSRVFRLHEFCYNDFIQIADGVIDTEKYELVIWYVDAHDNHRIDIWIRDVWGSTKVQDVFNLMHSTRMTYTNWKKSCDFDWDQGNWTAVQTITQFYK